MEFVKGKLNRLCDVSVNPLSTRVVKQGHLIVKTRTGRFLVTFRCFACVAAAEIKYVIIDKHNRV